MINCVALEPACTVEIATFGLSTCQPASAPIGVLRGGRRLDSRRQCDTILGRIPLEARAGEWHNRFPEVLGFRMRFRDSARPSNAAGQQGRCLRGARELKITGSTTDMPGTGGCSGGLNGYN